MNTSCFLLSLSVSETQKYYYRYNFWIHECVCIPIQSGIVSVKNISFQFKGFAYFQCMNGIHNHSILLHMASMDIDYIHIWLENKVS